MGYAYENTPYELYPDSEKLALWEMTAKVRDSFLTYEEHLMKLRAIDDMKKEQTKMEQEDFNYDTSTNYCALGALLTMQPMPKRSLKRRLLSRLWDVRYRLASKLAGFDVTNQDW